MSIEKYLLISKDLEKKLVELKFANGQMLTYSQKAMTICITAFLELKDTAIRAGFDNQQDEIEFFKNVKPVIYGKLIYFTNIFSLESKRTLSSNKVQRKYLNADLKKIQFFINDNLEFYKYYKCNDTIFDAHYFVRKMAEVRPCIGSLLFMIDPDFSTSHDHILAVFIANEMLSTYLKTEIYKLDSKFGKNEIILKEEDFIDLKINWMESKIALIELIYALLIVGAIKRENGDSIDIKELAEFTEKVLHIDLGDVYRAFAGMKLRKKERTKFLDYLRERLLNKMDDDDQRET